MLNFEKNTFSRKTKIGSKIFSGGDETLKVAKTMIFLCWLILFFCDSEEPSEINV